MEEEIKKQIIKKYGSIRQFAFKINIPYTTIDSILKRGIDNSNVGNVITMCKALNISLDKTLNENRIVYEENDTISNNLTQKLIQIFDTLNNEQKVKIIEIINILIK